MVKLRTNRKQLLFQCNDYFIGFQSGQESCLVDPNTNSLNVRDKILKGLTGAYLERIASTLTPIPPCRIFRIFHTLPTEKKMTKMTVSCEISRKFVKVFDVTQPLSEVDCLHFYIVAFSSKTIFIQRLDIWLLFRDLESA